VTPLSTPARLSLASLVVVLAACGAAGSSPGGAAKAGVDGGVGSPSSSGGAPTQPVTRGDAGVTTPVDGAAPGSPVTGTPDAGVDAGPAATTIRIHYPAGAHAITLRGSLTPYNWTTGVALTSGASDTWTITTPVISAPLEFKPLLDDTTWSLGPNYIVSPGASVDIYPRFTTVNGAYTDAFQWTSTLLGNTRGIWVYLPPSYNENTDAHFPVIYMHDGQNLFDPAASFNGTTWQIDTAMDNGATDGSIAETIVIGAENTAARMSEYTPVPDPDYDDGGDGNGANYIKALITELKPKIDAMYRTIPDRDHTFMMGSSLGGLISAYAGVEDADVYGGVGILSPSTFWDNNWIIGEVGTIGTHAVRANRVYLDSGNAGDSDDDEPLTAQLATAYQTQGYVQGTTFDYLVQNGGQHSETYWAERAPGALAFLIGPRPLLPPPGQ
jgi:predicted alpha/beta superfamily hydrolase